MSQTLILGFVFVAGASIGYTYIFRTKRIRASMARICSGHSLTSFLLRRWLYTSAYSIPTLKLMGVLGLAVAAVAYVAFMSRLVHRIP
jgi:hypothetical protein